MLVAVVSVTMGVPGGFGKAGVQEDTQKMLYFIQNIKLINNRVSSVHILGFV